MFSKHCIYSFKANNSLNSLVYTTVSTLFRRRVTLFCWWGGEGSYPCFYSVPARSKPKHLKRTLMKRNGGSLIPHCIPSVDSALGTIMIGSPGASGPDAERGAWALPAVLRSLHTPHLLAPRNTNNPTADPYFTHSQ